MIFRHRASTRAGRCGSFPAAAVSCTSAT